MAVKIIVDSASDIQKQFADENDIIFLPVISVWKDGEYLDGVNLNHKEFYEKLIESDEIPSTSQVTPYAFEEAYKQVVNAGDTAVVITISSKLSGTYQSATAAISGYENNIVLVDSQSASIGFKILVEYAMRLREQGLEHKAIAQEIENVRGKVCTVALLDTLEYLKKGGRISKTAALAGTMLSIKPVISVADGEIKVLGKARGSKNGNNYLIEEIKKVGGVDFSMPYALGYTGLDDTLLKKYIEDSRDLWEGQTSELPICTIGCAIGTHAGPGAVVVSFFKK